MKKEIRLEEMNIQDDQSVNVNHIENLPDMTNTHTDARNNNRKQLSKEDLMCSCANCEKRRNACKNNRDSSNSKEYRQD